MPISRYFQLSSWLIIAAFLLFFPLIWLNAAIPVSLPFLFRLFTPASFALLCLILILTNFQTAATYLRRWWIGPPLLCLLLLSLIHLGTRVNEFGLTSWLEDLFWIAPLLTGALCAAFLIRSLPLLFLLIWLTSAAISIRELWNAGDLYGLTGNYNWNATVLVASAVVVLGLLFRRQERFKSLRRQLLAAILVLLTLRLAYACHSKGTFVALVAAMILFYWFECRRLRPYLAGAAIIGLGATATVLYWRGTGWLLQIDGNIRASLWQGTINLIQHFWWNGTSAAAFENELVGKLPLEYYLSPLAATRNNHPHNQILYQFGIWGVFGGIAWLLLTVTPLIIFFRRYREWSLREKLPVCALLILLFHGMIDLLIFEWPGNIMFMLLLGVLWYLVCRTTPLREIRITPALVLFGRITAVIAVMMLLDLLCRTACGSFYYREGTAAFLHKDDETAAVRWHRSLDYLPDEPMYIFKQGTMLATRLKNYELAINRLQTMPPSSRHFANTNAYLGRMLLQQGRPLEALPYLNADALHFPLNSVTHLCLFIAYDRLNRKEAAAREEQMTIYTLRLKGLDRQALPFLMENPFYDLRWREIPPEVPRARQ